MRYLALLQAAGRVAIASGNHDLTGPDAQGEQAALWLAEARAAGVPSDGDSLLLGDTLVTICPWWDGPLGLATLERQLAVDAERRPHRWLWVYHWPPLDSPTSWTGKRHYGDGELNALIARHRPDVVLSAICTRRPSSPRDRGPTESMRPGASNAGRQIEAVPCHVAIDLGEGTASWRSLKGSESLHLAAAQAPEAPCSERGRPVPTAAVA